MRRQLDAGIAAQAFPAEQELTLAQAYVPMQVWETPMMPKEALRAGTVFPSLEMPFMMGKGGCKDENAVRSVFFADAKG